MNQPKISIIIPVYNVEPYIAECLQSVMRQTYQGPMECIVVDDCGTDKSIEVAERLISNYHGPIQFKVLHHEYNRGLSASRNTGIDAAKGNYVFFLDSDDWIKNDCLEVLTNPLKEKDYDMVLADCELTENPFHITYLNKETGPIYGNETIFREFYVDRTLFVMAWNKLFKLPLFKEYDLRFLEGQIHEDNLWTYKTALCMDSLYVQNSKTYVYRVRPNSINSVFSTRTRLRLQSWLETVNYVLEHPAKVNKPCYDKCLVYAFGQVVRFIIHDNESHKTRFVALRKRFDYHPLLLFLKGELLFKELKCQLYLVLPPCLGYAYIGMRKTGWRLLGRQRRHRK